MNPRSGVDARIAAFFETAQPDLPDRAFDAIRRDIHRTRQIRSFPYARYSVAAALVLAVGIVVLGLRPSGGPGGVPSPTPSQAVVPPTPGLPTPPSTPSGPSRFASPLYGYSLTLPAGWISAAALVPWDGVRGSGPDADTDRFAGPGTLSAWAFAGPFDGNLAAFAADRIAASARDHADTCPQDAFAYNDPLEIDGQAWAILGWNCGALINQAITIRAGVAYAITFRDLGIQSATDPADRLLFLSILDSVELPE